MNNKKKVILFLGAISLVVFGKYRQFVEKHKGKTTIEGKVSERATSSVGKNSKEGKTNEKATSSKDGVAKGGKTSEKATSSTGNNEPMAEVKSVPQSNKPVNNVPQKPSNEKEKRNSDNNQNKTDNSKNQDSKKIQQKESERLKIDKNKDVESQFKLNTPNKGKESENDDSSSGKEVKSMMYKVQVRFLFHSDIKIKIPEIYDDSVFDDLFGILEDVNKRYNSYSENSYIDKVNKNSGYFVKVDIETVEILRKIIHMSKIIGGEYDITIMPLIRLWGFYKQNPVLPCFEKIKKVKRLVDYKKIVIDRKRNRVRIGKNQEIITGSFIKAYAIEKMVEEMKKIGIKDAIVNAGGSSIIAIDEWGIIAENPEDEKEVLRNVNGMPTRITKYKYSGNGDNDLFEIKIKNMSYSTSNQKNTYLIIDNEKYGHIISPKTGFPSQNKQVGVITENAFFGDIISTGLYNQTPEGFYEIMEKLSCEMEISGFLIDKSGKIHYFNMEKYF